LFWLGIFGIAFFNLFQPINKSFPSLGSIEVNQNISSFSWLWKFLLFPILYYLSILIYSIRSYLSKRKILLSFFGLLALLIGWSPIIDKLNPNNQITKKQITVKQIEQKSISVKPLQNQPKITKINSLQKPQTLKSKAIIEKAKNTLSEKGNILNQPNSIWLIKLKKPIILKSGDPLADLRLNPSVKPEALEREKMRLGLDQPLWKQYTLWLDGILVRGDLGLTQQGEAVLTVIKKPLANTLLLNLIVLIFTWLISIPLGLYAAIHKNKITDQIVLTLSSVSITTPSFLLTIFILAMAVKLGLGSVGGLTSVNFDELNFAQKFLDIASHLVLPVLILTFVSIGGLIRQMRGNLLDVLNEDYIKAALARGIPRNQVLWNHAMQNAINPLITLLGFEFAALVSGAALTEMILAYPGIGALTLEAARRMDVNLIMFNLLLGTIMLMLGNSFADWLLRKVDPRIKR
jgi:peptide/nickel transport system permease protein